VIGHRKPAIDSIRFATSEGLGCIRITPLYVVDGDDRPRGPDILIIIITLISLMALCLPCHGEDSSIFPDNIRLNQQHKLIAAFVLGELCKSCLVALFKLVW